MKRGGISKEFIISLFVIAIIFLIIGFYFIPQERYIEFVGTGSSMEPTFYDGDVLYVDPQAKPEEMDIIVFSCENCEGISPDEILTKRIYKINESGCFWLVGDNRQKSLDSSIFGWLCKDDMTIFGVVVGKKT